MHNDSFGGVENSYRSKITDKTELLIFDYLVTIRTSLSKLFDYSKRTKKLSEIFEVESAIESAIIIFNQGPDLDKKAHYLALCLKDYNITKERLERCFSTRGIRNEDRKKLLIEQYNTAKVAIEKITGWVEYVDALTQ